MYTVTNERCLWEMNYPRKVVFKRQEDALCNEFEILKMNKCSEWEEVGKYVLATVVC